MWEASWQSCLALGLALGLSGCGESTHNHAKDSVGLDCEGQVITTFGVTPYQTTNPTCQTLCDSDPDCHAWSYDVSGGTCSLKRYCDNFIFAQPHFIGGWKPYLPNNLICPEPEKTRLCPGNDVAVVENATFQDCCDWCHNTSGCLVFSLNGSDSGTCHLKNRCPKKKKVTSWPSRTGWLQRPGRRQFRGQEMPFYKVGRGWFNVSGYACGDHYPATAIWYPAAKGDLWGLVVMRPGMGGQLDYMDDWMVTIASLGVVVVAPFTDRGTCDSQAWWDMLLALQAIYEGNLSQCVGCERKIGKIDFQKVAFMGHSMGAKAAIQASYRARKEKDFPYAKKVQVQAVVASHDAFGVKGIPKDVAFMVTGGGKDRSMDVRGINETWHNASCRRKIGTVMHGAHHMEPVAEEKLGWGNGGARENWWTAQFLACHVGPNATQQKYCDAVYGSNDASLSQMHRWDLFLLSNGSREGEDDDEAGDEDDDEAADEDEGSPTVAIV